MQLRHEFSLCRVYIRTATLQSFDRRPINTNKDYSRNFLEASTSEANPLQLVERTSSDGSSSRVEETFDWNFLDDLIWIWVGFEAWQDLNYVHGFVKSVLDWCMNKLVYAYKLIVWCILKTSQVFVLYFALISEEHTCSFTLFIEYVLEFGWICNWLDFVELAILPRINKKISEPNWSNCWSRGLLLDPPVNLETLECNTFFFFFFFAVFLSSICYYAYCQEYTIMQISDFQLLVALPCAIRVFFFFYLIQLLKSFVFYEK